MPEDIRMTYRQCIFLIFISRIIISLTFLPAFVSPPANQDIWLSTLLSFPISLLLALPLYLLWKKFPEQSFIQYSQTIMGKAGKLTGLLYVWFFLHNTAISLIQFCQFLIVAIMPETPILFFAISFILVCAYAVSKGIEVIGRMSEIIVVVIMAAIFTIVALLAKDMDLRILTPVMEDGFFPVLHGGFTIAARTVEILGLALLLPFLNDRTKVKTILVSGFFLMSMVFLITTLSIQGTFGVEEPKNLLFPFFSTVRIASGGDFLERVEAIHVGIWVLGVFIKISFFFYLTVMAMGQLFKLKDHNVLVVPTGALIVPLSILIGSSIVELKEFVSYKIFTWYALFFTFLIPSILLIIALVRKKGAWQQ